ncbi:hypothetical protein [Bacillus sp. UNC41MFS5]|uniref:hypothetical protein n=1 Tax=Bacillus sp. UNC41MFS5 TaxID=1449046 RepID=UPI000A50495C|nr:hypothetical protein [Bacillus sp. UNC41MFS5]
MDQSLFKENDVRRIFLRPHVFGYHHFHFGGPFFGAPYLGGWYGSPYSYGYGYPYYGYGYPYY